jgi:hypothetical protein
MVIPDSVIEQLKGLSEKWRSQSQRYEMDVTAARRSGYQDVAASLGARLTFNAAEELDTLLSTLLAAPRDQGDAQETPVLRVEVFREADGRYAAEFFAPPGEGGMAEYANTPVGALAELCATLIKIDEDKAHERAASRSPEGTEKA